MDWLNRNVAAIIALAIVGCCFGLFVLYSQGQIDPANKEIILMILGAITATLSQVVGYFFGSSQGSARKTEFLTGPPTLAAEIKSFTPPGPAVSSPPPDFIDGGPPEAVKAVRTGQG